MTNNQESKLSLFCEKHSFWLILIFSIIARNTPYLSLPFNWLETYFHEISHGLSAIATGGSIKNIEINMNGSGLCRTIGGISFIITFMGYAGATFWGWAIYKITDNNKKISKIFLPMLIFLLSISLTLWTRDILTAAIIISLIAVFAMALLIKDAKFIRITLQLTGVTVLLNSLISPFHLIDGKSLGDGASLADSTFIPEFFWIAIWAGIALFACYSLAKGSNK